MTTFQKSLDRFGIARGIGSGKCSNRLSVRLHQVRQGRGNLFLQRHTFGGLRKVRHVRVRDPDRPNHLFGFAVPVDQRWQPALLLVRRYAVVELQQQLHVDSSSSSSSSSSSTSSSSTSSGGGSITGATCSSSGSQSITATIRVTSGTYDGGCRTFNPSGALGDGSQEEGQDPAFRVENGATLRNAILGNNGVDGVHFYNGGNLQNFRWTNVGEDAFTVKSSGTVNISGVTRLQRRRQVRPDQRCWNGQPLELHRRQRREGHPPERRHDLQDHGQHRPLPALEPGGRRLPFRQLEQRRETDQQPPAQQSVRCASAHGRAARVRGTRTIDRDKLLVFRMKTEAWPGVETPPAFSVLMTWSHELEAKTNASARRYVGSGSRRSWARRCTGHLVPGQPVAPD